MKNKRYLTQLTAAEIEQMLAAGKMKQGRGIIIRNAGGALTIEVDPQVIIDIIWCFVRQGLVCEGLSGSPCVVPYNAKDTRTRAITDPNQFT